MLGDSLPRHANAAGLTVGNVHSDFKTKTHFGVSRLDPHYYHLLGNGELTRQSKTISCAVGVILAGWPN